MNIINLLHSKGKSGFGHNFLPFCTNHGCFFKCAVLGLRKKIQGDLEKNDNQGTWLRLIKEGLLDGLEKTGSVTQLKKILFNNLLK